MYKSKCELERSLIKLGQVPIIIILREIKLNSVNIARLVAAVTVPAYKTQNAAILIH